MARHKSYNEILKELKDRKKFEVNNKKIFEEMKCKKCNQHISQNWVSRVSGICGLCVSDILKPKTL